MWDAPSYTAFTVAGLTLLVGLGGLLIVLINIRGHLPNLQHVVGGREGGKQGREGGKGERGREGGTFQTCRMLSSATEATTQSSFAFHEKSETFDV